VLTDRPAYALAAGLLVPPELAILSLKRMTMLHRGSPQYLPSLLDKYKPAQVLLVRHEHYPAAFTARLDRDYVRLPYEVDGARHFIARPAAPAPVDSQRSH
jgi:hypothetical protein